MKIALLNESTLYWLAGQTGVAQSVHSSVREFVQTAGIVIDERHRVRATGTDLRDRGNLRTDISFGTTRKFDSTAEADEWAVIYDAVMPRTGYLVFYDESDAVFARLENAIVSPPQRRITGVSLDLRYQVVGGRILVPDGEGGFGTPEITMGGEGVTMG